MFDTTHARPRRRSGIAIEVRESLACPAEGGLRDAPKSDGGRKLIEAVAQALGATGHAELRKLDIEICEGVVVLWGRVTTYHQKQLAQATAQKVEGVRGIANGLEVICCRCRATRSDRL